MRREARTITLGERSWTVRPLTLAQLQDIEGINARREAGGMSHIRYSAEIVAVGLSREDAGAAAAVLDMSVEATIGNIADASATVLYLGGFVPETVLGEAGAGAAPASTGEGSTPAS